MRTPEPRTLTPQPRLNESAALTSMNNPNTEPDTEPMDPQESKACGGPVPLPPPHGATALTKCIVNSLMVWLMLPVGVSLYLGWDAWQETQPVASQPIGTLVGLSAGGGLDGWAVLATETGFYPVQRPLVAARGTALQLEVRRNGARYVCARERAACVKTTRESLR